MLGEHGHIRSHYGNALQPSSARARRKFLRPRTAFRSPPLAENFPLYIQGISSVIRRLRRISPVTMIVPFRQVTTTYIAFPRRARCRRRRSRYKGRAHWHIYGFHYLLI